MENPTEARYTGDLRQAIITKYLGPTDRRGSRVKATAEAGSVTLEWNDALDIIDNHWAAALALANRYGWLERCHLRAGGTAEGYFWVLVSNGEWEKIITGGTCACDNPKIYCLQKPMGTTAWESFIRCDNCGLKTVTSIALKSIDARASALNDWNAKRRS